MVNGGQREVLGKYVRVDLEQDEGSIAQTFVMTLTQTVILVAQCTRSPAAVPSRLSVKCVVF